jgi:uncharacterized protein (TIGR03437 family)
VGLQLDSNNNVSTNLADTTVTFDGISAPLIEVSATKIIVIAPYEINGRNSVRLVVQTKGQSSTAISLVVAATAPGIFVNKVVGTGYLTILNADLSVNSAAKPAAQNTIVNIFATGEGVLNPSVKTGSIATPSSGSFAKPANPVSLKIGGQTAQVQYAGQGPGLVSGVLEIQAIVPAGSTGSLPVLLAVGNADTTLQSVMIVVA